MEKDYVEQMEFDEGFKISENVNPMQPIKKKRKFTSILKGLFFNVIGFYAGYYLGYFAMLIAKYVLIDLLGELKFLTALLSWPVDYETYALTGIIFIDALVSLRSCAFISHFGKTKYNYSCYVLGVLRILNYIVTALNTISSNGFSFSFVWTMIVCLLGFGVITFGAATNEEL